MGRIAAIDGDVYLPFHGYLPTLAGKDSYAHEMAMRDIFKGRDELLKQAVRDEINAALRSRRFEAIILDAASVFDGIDRYYQLSTRVFDERYVFWPVTGRRTRPTSIYVPENETTARVLNAIPKSAANSTEIL